LVRRTAARASMSSSIGYSLVGYPAGTVRQPITVEPVPDTQFLVIGAARYIVSRRSDGSRRSDDAMAGPTLPHQDGVRARLRRAMRGRERAARMAPRRMKSR
jgi:hypothetical protein